jgi:hypothetical protein
MSKWIADDEGRSARARESRIIAASAYADLALKELRAVDNPLSLGKAREIASHYRWQASKASPKEYGDKLDLSVDATVKLVASQMTDEQLAEIATGK